MRTHTTRIYVKTQGYERRDPKRAKSEVNPEQKTHSNRLPRLQYRSNKRRQPKASRKKIHRCTLTSVAESALKAEELIDKRIPVWISKDEPKAINTKILAECNWDRNTKGFDEPPVHEFGAALKIPILRHLFGCEICSGEPQPVHLHWIQVPLSIQDEESRQSFLWQIAKTSKVEGVLWGFHPTIRV